jgi:hypothetical protein
MVDHQHFDRRRRASIFAASGHQLEPILEQRSQHRAAISHCVLAGGFPNECAASCW